MQYFHFDSVDSTNEEAKRLLSRGAITGAAYILAREQTVGKGSRGRSWLSPADAGLYLSVVQRFQGGLETAGPSLPELTLSAGVACAEVLRDLLTVDIRLKPINDLYVGDSKLGGILVESVVHGNRIDALITGVGINLLDVPRRLPDTAPPAISLQSVVSPHLLAGIDRLTLAAKLSEAILHRHADVLEGRTAGVREAWQRLAKPGARLPIELGSQPPGG